MDWEDVGIVRASQHRQDILGILAHRSSTPKEMAEALKIHLSQVTRNLREMEKRGMIECMTPQLRKGRIYTITNKGREILEQAKSK
jgi:DNA-binding MarR family transcriptional regulator